MGLKYLGKNASQEFLPGVPARDLTDKEMKEFPDAAKSPLYRKVQARPAAKKEVKPPELKVVPEPERFEEESN